MADQIGMSLDEIIKKNKSQFSRKGRGAGKASRGAGKPGRARSQFKNTGGRGKTRGGGGNRSSSRGRGGFNSSRGRGGFNSARGRGGFNRGGGRGSMRGGRNFGGSRPASGGAVVNGAISTGKTKLMIANLHYGVSDSDIKELFSEFGRIINSAVHYDKSGKSLGTAHVLFDSRANALKAKNHYQNIDLDQRPMRISIENEPRSVAPKSPARGRGQGLKRLGRGGPNKSMGKTGGRGGKRGRGGRGGRGGGRGRRGGGPKKMPTAEELDAELDAYTIEASK